MDLLTLAGLVILAPVLVKFVDRAYKALKHTELYRDLSDNEES